MSPEPSATWRQALRAALGPLAFIAGLVLLGDVLLHRIPWPAQPMDLVGENGRLELAQIVVLLGFGLTTAAVARRFAAVRPLAILMTGLAVAILVREQNNVLKDHTARWVWKALVGLVVVASLAAAYPSRRRLPGALLDLLGRPAGGLLTAAVALLLYGQLFDEIPFWQFILGQEDAPLVVRRVAEEGIELAAYALALAGAVAWRVGLARSGLRGQGDA